MKNMAQKLKTMRGSLSRYDEPSKFRIKSTLRKFHDAEIYNSEAVHILNHNHEFDRQMQRKMKQMKEYQEKWESNKDLLLRQEIDRLNSVNERVNQITRDVD